MFGSSNIPSPPKMPTAQSVVRGVAQRVASAIGAESVIGSDVPPQLMDAESLFNQPLVADKAGMTVIEPNRWHLLYPYEIVVYDARDNFEFVYALPIPPEALSLSTQVASEAFASLGGVVEQTSENTFTTITLQGTTGIAVNRESSSKPARGDEFRQIAQASGMISGAIDQLANTIQSVADMAADFSTDDLVGSVGGLLTQKQWFKRSAVNVEKNGYYEILLLKKFLDVYASGKEADPLRYSLYFRTHKENLEWRVVLKEFRIQKAKDSPYLYRYTMMMKGWSQRSPLRQEKEGADRFAKGGDLAICNGLTATGVLQKVRSVVNTIRRGPSAIVDALVQVRPLL